MKAQQAFGTVAALVLMVEHVFSRATPKRTTAGSPGVSAKLWFLSLTADGCVVLYGQSLVNPNFMQPHPGA